MSTLLSAHNRMTNHWLSLETFNRMRLLGQEQVFLNTLHDFRMDFEQKIAASDAPPGEAHPREYVIARIPEFDPSKRVNVAIDIWDRTIAESLLVFGHAILDAAILDCLKWTAVADSSAWGSFVQERKITLRQALSITSAELMSVVVSEELARLERESLLKKIDRLFAITQPDSKSYLKNGFRFDRQRLIAVDEMRHAVVHKPNEPRPNVESIFDIPFMRDVGRHAVLTTNARFPGADFPISH